MTMKYVLLTCFSLSKFCALESGIPFFLELSVGPAVVSPPFSWRRLIEEFKRLAVVSAQSVPRARGDPSLLPLPVGDHLDIEADWAAGFRKP